MSIYEEKNIFLEKLKNKYSKGAYSNSKRSIDKFCLFFHNYNFNEISLHKIQNDFVDFLKVECNFNDTTVYGVFIELNKFIKFLKEKNIVKINPSDILTKEIRKNFNIAKRRNVFRRFSTDEEDLMINYWSNELPLPINFRNEIILKLIFYYGLKTGEISKIKISDIDTKSEELSITSDKAYRNRKFKINRDFLDLIEYYLNCRDNNSEFLLIQESLNSKKVNHITERSIQRIIEQTAFEVGIYENTARATSGRYTFGTKKLIAGESIKQVAKNLGYSSSNQVNFRYAKVKRIKKIKIGKFISAKNIYKKLGCSFWLVKRLIEKEGKNNEICRKIGNSWFINENVNKNYILQKLRSKEDENINF